MRMDRVQLLEVLNMGEDEQDRWCAINTNRKGWEHLADLAFRLRDEVIKEGLDWDDALILVWKILGRSMKYQTFCKYYTKPIHWIIAALIAKGNDD